MDDNKKLDLVYAYRKLFSSPEGEQVLVHLMDVAGFFETSMVEPNYLIFQRGQASLVNIIIKNMSWDPIKLKQLMENRHKEVVNGDLDYEV